MKVQGEHMMDAMQICQMTSYEAPLHPHNEVIIGECMQGAVEKTNPISLERITAIMFLQTWLERSAPGPSTGQAYRAA